MIPDKLLINLKILNKIQKNGRICRSYDGIISLEQDTMYQPLKRFLTSDSRKQAVFEINSIITECIETLSNITNSKFMDIDNSKTDYFLKGCENLHLLISEMDLAKIGIINLKFTYQEDPNVATQLDIVILKLNTAIRDYSHKLLYYQSFLPNIYGDNFNPQNQYKTSQVELNSVKIDEKSDDNTEDIIQMEPII
jgi:hypothetical protein